MTQQILDTCVHEGTGWAIVQGHGTGYCHPGQWGMQTQMESTANYRGCVLTYAVADDRLTLREARLHCAGDYRPIAGVMPSAQGVYSEIGLPVAFTGWLRLGTGCRPGASHRFFDDPAGFGRVIDLEFDDGRLVACLERDPDEPQMNWRRRYVCACCGATAVLDVPDPSRLTGYRPAMPDDDSDSDDRSACSKDDLDLRPDDRWLAGVTVQQCPTCTLSAQDIQAIPPVIARWAVTVAAPRLQADGFAGPAHATMLAALVARACGAPRDAMALALHAGWISDAQHPAAAGRAREFVVRLWPPGRPEGSGPFARCDPGAQALLHIDLLRRTGRFADAVAAVQTQYAREPVRAHTGLYRFQEWLSQRADDARRRISEMPPGLRDEIAPWNRAEVDAELVRQQEAVRARQTHLLARQRARAALIALVDAGGGTERDRIYVTRSPLAFIRSCVAHTGPGRLPRPGEVQAVPAVRGAMLQYVTRLKWPEDRWPLLLALALVDADPSLAAHATPALPQWRTAVHDCEDLLAYLTQAIHHSTSLDWAWKDTLDWREMPRRR